MSIDSPTGVENGAVPQRLSALPLVIDDAFFIECLDHARSGVISRLTNGKEWWGDDGGKRVASTGTGVIHERGARPPGDSIVSHSEELFPGQDGRLYGSFCV